MRNSWYASLIPLFVIFIENKKTYYQIRRKKRKEKKGNGMKYVYLWSCASVVEPCNDVDNVHDMIDITKPQLNQFFLHPSFLNR